jgi:hypothetical protein
MLKPRALGEKKLAEVGAIILRVSMVYGGISNFMGNYFRAASSKASLELYLRINLNLNSIRRQDCFLRNSG